MKAGGFEKKMDTFFVFNNGSAGDGEATFSFGGSHNEDFSEVKHGEDAVVLQKWDVKEVYADPGKRRLLFYPGGRGMEAAVE